MLQRTVTSSKNFPNGVIILKITTHIALLDTPSMGCEKGLSYRPKHTTLINFGYAKIKSAACISAERPPKEYPKPDYHHRPNLILNIAKQTLQH